MITQNLAETFQISTIKCATYMISVSLKSWEDVKHTGTARTAGTQQERSPPKTSWPIMPLKSIQANKTFTKEDTHIISLYKHKVTIKPIVIAS